MDDFKISQLTKEIVAAKVKQAADPCAAAAELAKETLKVALRGVAAGGVADSAVVEDACKGAMTALLLADQDLPRGAVLILEAACEAGLDLDIDHMALMRDALRGIADMRRFSPPSGMNEISNALEARFHGAGSAFDAFCAEGARREEDAPQTSAA